MTKDDGESDTGATIMRPNSLQLDPAKYREELDRFDITDAQKQELLMTLWSIMRSFVELGFTVDVCGALLDEKTIVPGADELN